MKDTNMNERVSLKPLTARELLAKEFIPQGWLINGLLKEREIALIYAPTGVGKSWFGWSLGCMVAGGGSGIFEYSNDVPRKVLLIDGEMDLQDTQERLLIGAQAVGADMDKLMDNFSILSRQYQTVGTKFLNLDDEAWQKRTLEYLQRHKVDLVILDNLSTLLKVDDENSASSLDGLTDFLLELKKAGVAAMVVHHANKAGTGYRGSSKIGITFNLILSLRKPKGAPITGACFEVLFEKVRGRINDIPYRLTLSESFPEGELGKPRYSWETAEGDERALRAWEALETGEFPNYDALGAHLGVGKATAWRWIAKAIQVGITDQTLVVSAFERAKTYSEVILSPEF